MTLAAPRLGMSLNAIGWRWLERQQCLCADQFGVHLSSGSIHNWPGIDARLNTVVS